LTSVPRQRTARVVRLGGFPRPPDSPTRDKGVTVRRLVAAVLVLVSLGLITLYLRESDDGGLHAAQRIGLAVLAPFQTAGERVARPFQDAYSYVSDLVDAKSEKDALERQVQELSQDVIRYQTAAQENTRLRDLLRFVEGSRFPDDFRGVATRVIAQPAGPYNQEILVAAGSNDGVAVDAPVVTEDGLVGLVTAVAPDASKVTLLTDQSIAVSSVDLASGARGVVKAAPSAGSGLVLDRVGKEQVVEEGDTIITAGWRTGELASIYPWGIAIGTVTSVGQQDIDLYKRVQVAPFVDFDSLSEVVVLVKK
jgi:rod shape-determining protein MreC